MLSLPSGVKCLFALTYVQLKEICDDYVGEKWFQLGKLMSRSFSVRVVNKERVFNAEVIVGKGYILMTSSLSKSVIDVEVIS